MAASSPGLEEERGTLHVMDDQQRIAMVETRTVTTTGTTTTVHGDAPRAAEVAPGLPPSSTPTVARPCGR
jgi:hypothetical protein